MNTKFNPRLRYADSGNDLLRLWDEACANPKFRLAKLLFKQSLLLLKGEAQRRFSLMNGLFESSTFRFSRLAK
ncbi:hypothetical protein OH492_09605 [Vibrio chagasii]|nr:hypothetical protein [Vibrio chagasii]